MNLIKFHPNDSVFGYTTTRQNGISLDHLKSFNLSFTVGDDPNHVIANRNLLANEVGMPLEKWVFARQCHSDQIAEVSSKDAGRGSRDHQDGIPNVDGLYTFDKDLVLAFFHADCVPILFTDETTHLIGAIHSGWQGTLQEITRKAFTEIIKKHHVDPNDIKVYVGPCLSYESSDIGQDIEPYLNGSTFDKSAFLTKTNHGTYKIDTRGLTMKMLADVGIPQANIQVINEDTCSLPDKYFSFQRDTETGRHLTFVYQK